MQCPFCDLEIPEESLFCPNCGKSLARSSPSSKSKSMSSSLYPPSTAPIPLYQPPNYASGPLETVKRDVKVLVIIDFVFFTLNALVLLFYAIVWFTLPPEFRDFFLNQITPFDMILISLFVFSLVSYLVAAIGLLKRKKWGIIVHLIIWTLQLLNFPIGTLIGVYSLHLYSKPEIKAYFEDQSNSFVGAIPLV